MCGIITIAGKNTEKINDTTVNNMLSCLSSRGPDDQGFIRFPKCILGQTRLSIIDLSGGHQPMRDNKQDLTITFNGEIYNYKELKKELENKGHNFSTNSDTEVILKSYIEYGDKCTEKLDGMFAFVIWDNKNEELFMARDRFGKKPLYYTFKEGAIIIASETRALVETGIKGTVDPQAIDNYLTLMYVPPWKTIYKNIHTLPPAHQAIYKSDELFTERYWQLKDAPVSTTYEEARTEIKKLLDLAVKKRMVADVEVGALLSGGLDSTLVCHYAQKYSTHPLKTFTLVYVDHINELPYAEQASQKFGTEHHSRHATSDLTHELKKIIAYMDEPNADSSIFPQHLISELIASKVKVALSGDGADELFMGYGWYWKYWNTRKITRLKNAIFSNPFKEYIKNISIFSKDERKELWKDTSALNEDIYNETVGKIGSNSIKKINTFDLTTYLPGELLSKIDRTSMMNSLEVRSPFLDHKLAEYVYNIPTEFKTDKKQGKIILKDILSEIMPKEFVYRRKQGFGAPVIAWLKSESIKNLVNETLNSQAQIFNFLKEEKVRELIDDFYKKGNESIHYKIWSLLCLELWLSSHTKYHEHAI
jgi:asparagine synthase (glutamine-hydrolysing)